MTREEVLELIAEVQTTPEQTGRCGDKIGNILKEFVVTKLPMKKRGEL